MRKIIITAGKKFSDIDAFSCAIAYQELLELEGKKSEVILPGVLNSSVTETIRKWGFDYSVKPGRKNYSFVVVDLSNPDYLPNFVNLDKVVELYDHHYGFEDFWKKKIGGKAKIVMVGACATLIWEEWKTRGYASKISIKSARLLYVAIVSNTLNFGSSITDKRDLNAFDELAKFVNMEKDWKEIYFREQAEAIYKNPEKAIKNDTKLVNTSALKNLVIGQIELWDGKEFLTTHKEDARKALKSFGKPKWFLNLPSIREKKSYIYTENEEVKNVLTKLVGVEFDGDIGITSELLLRKQIEKKLSGVEES